MSDLRRWLANIGLERYADAFEQAEVDLAALPHLTEADLTGLGLPLGPRRRLSAALASDPPGPASAPPAKVAERRQITVMFVDLVGSTRLSADLDPEILADLMRQYKETVSATIAQAGGWLAKYLGDGVLAYFGWPHASEDAVESAVRCGFEAVERVRSLRDPGGRALQCRIGIASGLVVIGGEAGEGTAREDIVAGEVLNLAARLQALALPDEIVIADGARRQLGDVFEYQDLGEQALAGFAAPVRAWRPTRVAGHVSRFQAARGVRAALVGRADELSLLQRRWDAAQGGQGRTVLIVGEPGLGKSRLAAALHSRILDRPHTSVVWQCSPFHQAKPLHPAVRYIAEAAGIADGAAPDESLRSLKTLLADAAMPLDSALPLFAQLLAIPPEAGYAAPALGPAQLRSATIVTFGELIRRLAAQSPMLLLLEDAHWADPTTLELAVHLVASAAASPLMTVVTARPEFVSPWAGQPDIDVIGLERLSDAQCEDLVRALGPAASADDSLIRTIVSRGDGNPLYLEELSAAVFDDRAGAAHVPDSLQSSLMARLDRLGDAKRTAQICSVLGRRFARPLLLLAADLPPKALDDNLALLVAHDVLRPLGYAAEGRFEFKHALVRDAAYESLLLAQRRRLHAACGRHLERDFPDVVRTEPELLAQHFTLAGLPADASRHWEQAGDRASQAGASAEVVVSLNEAIRQNDLLPEGPQRDRRTLDLLLKLGPAASIVDGPQSPRLKALYQRAEDLSRALDDQDALFKSVWGLWYNANIARELDEAANFAQRLVRISEQSQDADQQFEAFHCRWSSALFRGDYATCGVDSARGVELYDMDRHRKLGLIFGGHDPGVCAYGCQAQSLAYAGDVDAGRRSAHSAIALAEVLDHPPSLAHGLLTGLIITTVVADTGLVESWAGRMLDLGRKFNVKPQQAVGAYHLAWIEAMTGSQSRGLDDMAALYGQVTAMGPITLLYRVMYIDQLLRAGRGEEALQVADAAVAGLRYPDDGLLLCELYRLRGAALAAVERAGEATAELHRAAAMAARGGAPLLQLRALTHLHRLEASARSADALRAGLAAIRPDAGAREAAEAVAVLQATVR